MLNFAIKLIKSLDQLIYLIQVYYVIYYGQIQIKKLKCGVNHKEE